MLAFSLRFVLPCILEKVELESELAAKEKRKDAKATKSSYRIFQTRKRQVVVGGLGEFRRQAAGRYQKWDSLQTPTRTASCPQICMC